MLELLVVILIIGILVGLLFPALLRARETARKRVAQSEVFELQKAWIAFWDTFGVDGDLEPESGEMNFVRVLMLAGENPQRIQFMTFSRDRLRNGMRDPWGEFYQVVYEPETDELRWTYQTRVYPRNVGRRRE